MSLSLYKPNSKNAGCAFNFSIGNDKKKEPVVYVNAIQQHSWDDKKKTGNFSGNANDPEKKINIKFTEFEIGGIISAFKNRHEFSSYHAYEENKTTIKCVPWDKKTKIKNKEGESWVTLPAFGITFTRNGNQTFRIPLEPGEVENVTEFLRFYLNTLYSHRKKEEIKKLKQYKSQNREDSSSDSEPTSEEAPF
jgi:hypothetical protein